MGTTTSAPTLTPEQKDIKYLGDRMPFGDAELYQVYRAYMAQKVEPKRISFLTDFGTLSLSNTSNPSISRSSMSRSMSIRISIPVEERLVWLQVSEQKILPTNFGNRLYQSTFLRKQDVSVYEKNGSASASGIGTDDDYTRLSKLEAFFDGLSNCTRRGAKKTLQVLIDCCQQHPAPMNESSNNMGSPGGPYSSTLEFSPYATAPNAKYNPSIQAKTCVDPMEFVNIGYRVSLASAFLSATTTTTGRNTNSKKEEGEGEVDNTDEDENDLDVSRFLPSDDASDHPGLKALADSLVEFSMNRKQRQYRSNAIIHPEDNNSTRLVSDSDIFGWAEQVAPMFASSLATFTHMVFFPNLPYPPSRTKFDYPSLSGSDSVFFSEESSPLLFSFGCMSSALGGEFYRLYTSASDGLSFNRLQNALLGYGGPTLIIIQSGNSVFGAFTASPWKESKDYYGNTDCFLYRLLPKTAVYRPSGNGHNFMYCNSFARSRGYDQQAHGIGFGGTVDQPRLFLAESFDTCQAAAQDMTFEKGYLLDEGNKSSHFEIDNLEVWGVGGTEVVLEALGARSRQRDIKNAAIQKARKVDKAAFLDDFRSGLIESKAFAHREQIRGREAACIDDNDLNNYKYPKN